MSRQRKYPTELLDRGARLVFESGRPIAHVARDLGVPAETLRKHLRQVEADEGLRPDLPTAAEREEMAQCSGTCHQPQGSSRLRQAAPPGYREVGHQHLDRRPPTPSRRPLRWRGP